MISITGKENENETARFDDHDRVIFSEYEGVENAKLTIETAQQSDRGYFSCIGNSTHMGEEVTSEGFVRVKDKLAALWPFIGICAEVFVLCAIILIYEKRRNKDSDNDSDTDQGDQ
jgi:neuroplastin